jgi:DNA adenine methylase
MRLIPMTNTHHATMEELVIGKDLSWMDRFTAVHEPEVGYTVKKTKKTRSNKSPKRDAAKNRRAR